MLPVHVHRNRGILTSLILKANVSHLSRGSDIFNLNANSMYIVVKQDTYILAKQMKLLHRKGTYTKV